MRSELKERFFTPDEIRGYEVVDSEGFRYGTCGGVEFSEEGQFLRVNVTVKVGEQSIDINELRLRLESKGVSLPSDITLEGLMMIAKEQGIQVPKKVFSSEVEILKAKVPISEIRWIDSVSLEYEDNKTDLRVILLSTPRETRYRGIEPFSKQEQPLLKLIKGKAVLSLGGGIVGIAGELVVGFGQVGLRAFRKKGSSRVIRWLPFITWLRREGYFGIAGKMVEIADPYKEPKLPASRFDEVLKVLEDLEPPPKVIEELSKSVVEVKGEDVYEDVPWSEVLKVGDYVIVK